MLLHREPVLIAAMVRATVVVALHGLWLRSEVKRSGALEVLEPEMWRGPAG